MQNTAGMVSRFTIGTLKEQPWNQPYARDENNVTKRLYMGRNIIQNEILIKKLGFNYRFLKIRLFPIDFQADQSSFEYHKNRRHS